MKEFLDIPHTISIVIGETTLSVARLLKLERGDIVELPKSAGETLDVFANKVLFARGEVTIIDDRFAIRIAEFYDSEEGKT